MTVDDLADRRTRALAVAVLLALAGCKDRTAKPAAPPPAPAPSVRAHPALATPAPRLPAPLPALAAPPAVEQAFAAEPVDAAWSGPTEQKLRARVAGAEVTCHQTLCELEVSGDDAQLAHAIDAMNGLSDLASSIVLTRDHATVRGYVRFERPAAQ